MGTLKKEEIIGILSELISEKAKTISSEERIRYEKENEKAYIDGPLADLIAQRTISEMMFRSCYFKASPDCEDRKQLTDEFEAWLASGEEEKLRAMVKTIIIDEIKKNTKPGEENLTFTEKYLRKVKEKGRTIDLIKGLNE